MTTTVGSPERVAAEPAAARRGGRGHRRRTRVAWIFLVPALLALLFTAIYPVGFAGVTSFLNWKLTRQDLGITFAGLSNYVNAFSAGGESLLPALGRTIVFVVVTVAAETALGLGLALLLYNRKRSRGGLIALLSLPMMLTPVAVAYIWRYMYSADNGVINWAISLFGGTGPVWLQSVDPPWLTFAAVIVVDVWQWTPFMMLLCIAGLTSVPVELVEAAATDGASSFQIMWRILLPLIRPVVLIAVLIRGINAFKEFDKIFIMTGGGPGTSTELVSYRMYVDALQRFDFGMAGVTGITLTFFTVLLAAGFLFVTRRSSR
nr:sugar ABC transporter permease [Propionicimonas sp.]